MPGDAYRGGNCNNGAQCGALYVNLNNSSGNTNWNIGASQSYPKSIQLNAGHFPQPLLKINSRQASVSSNTINVKMDERIRMKTYKHLYETYISDKNYEYSVLMASGGKNNHQRSRKFKYIREHSDELKDHFIGYASNFRNAEHRPVEIYDGNRGKKRTIMVPTVEEQIIHHMIVHTLEPVIMKGMYEHSYGSIPGRGPYKAKERIEKWIRNDPRNVKYCLQMDIHKFFDSIPHNILASKIGKVIKDDRFMRVILEVIDVQEVGIPIGFYTSQWLSNWYLQDLDHYIKEHTYSPHYVRFVDDMVIFGASKTLLRHTRKLVAEYLKEKLGLELKPNWQVFRFDYIDKDGNHYGRALDFLGFKFYRDHTVLRRGNMLRITRKADIIKKKEHCTVYDARQFMARIGCFKRTDSHNLYAKRIAPKVSVRKMKRKISAHDRRNNEFSKIRNIQLPAPS